MIYNFVKWLKNQNAGLTIYTNTVETPSVDKMVLVKEYGGPERPLLRIKSIQIICRDVDVVKAKQLADTIYGQIQSSTLIGGRFGQILPAVTVGGVVYPSVQIAQMRSIQLPGSIGQDENGRYEISFNFDVYF